MTTPSPAFESPALTPLTQRLDSRGGAYAVWAPRATRVELALEDGRVPMERALPPHYWPRSSHNGGAPTQRSPFPLLAGIKAQTLREEILHLA